MAPTALPCSQAPLGHTRPEVIGAGSRSGTSIPLTVACTRDKSARSQREQPDGAWARPDCGILNAVVVVVLDARRATRARRTSARLVAQEIQSNGSTLRACNVTGLWLAMRNHPLRFGTWETHADVLAGLPYDDWSEVAQAIRQVSQVDRVHGHGEHTHLSPMDPRHVQDAMRACEAAVLVLERHGKR